MGLVHAKALHQAAHGGRAQVGLRLLAVEQVIQRTLAQRALRDQHFVDVEQREDGSQHADAAADHSAAIILEPVHAHTIGAARGKQLGVQPVEPFACDLAFGRCTGRCQHVAHGAHGAGRSVGHVPGVALIGVERFVEHGLGRHLGGFKGARRELAVREIPRGPCHAAHAERCHGGGRELAAQDDFGGAATDVDHQTAFVRLR
ncbi:hypothetical protein SDC9_137856 [bioreactor metagenome]|uniref:Uncharacterized protein n=1 Tax=bioreactor metagenome TaxID=1076179 RepID=A0A645DMR3_9ZZZZ